MTTNSDSNGGKSQTPTQVRREAARSRACALRAGGASLDEIATELSVSRSTVYHWTRAVLNRPPTPRRQRRAEAVEKARALRSQGLPYAEIAERLEVSVSTVYGWVFDVPVPAGGARRGGGGRTVDERRETARRSWEPRLRAAEILRQQTKLAAANAVRPATDRDLFVAGLTAYWAEGAKDKDYRRQERVMFVNSDALMITLFRDWLDLLGIEPERRRHRLSIHETADLAKAESFWRDLLGLPADALQRATIKRHNPKTNRLRTGEDYNGCLVMSVTRSAELYRQIEGWWYGLAAAGRRSPGPPVSLAL